MVIFEKKIFLKNQKYWSNISSTKNFEKCRQNRKAKKDQMSIHIQAHENTGDLSVDTLFLKTCKRVFDKKNFRKKYKNFPKRLKENFEEKLIHFLNICFYHTEILGRIQSRALKFQISN